MYEGIKVAVIGDFMTDYWWEPENGVKLCPAFPAYDYRDKELIEQNDGGAGNTAECMRHLCAKVSVFAPQTQLQYHAKNYYTYQGVIMFRTSDHPPMVNGEAMREAQYLIEQLDEYDAVVMADYNKGCLTKDNIPVIIDACRTANKPVFVDPKFNNWPLYKGCDVFKCNLEEWHTQSEIPKDKVGLSRHFIITKGSNGMDVITDQGAGFEKHQLHIPGRGIEPVDVTGAGDTAMAVMALEYLRTGGDILKACHVANIGASLTVRHKRIYYVTVDEIRKEGGWDE